MQNVDITVLIRASGERTEDLCFEIIKNQVPPEQVFLIHEKPFAKAVKRNFEIGLEQGRKWTLAVDADVLLHQSAIHELLERVESLNKKILDRLFIYQGNVVCKVMGYPRHAGFHLYNTQYLEQALKHYEIAKTKIRPESAYHSYMRQNGCYQYLDGALYGIHDYQQYYRDCYRNGFFSAKKHFSSKKYILDYWSKKLEETGDLDYKCYLAGWKYGEGHPGEIKVDFDFFNQIVATEFPKMNISEKEPIELSIKQTHSEIAKILRAKKLEFKSNPKLLKNTGPDLNSRLQHTRKEFIRKVLKRLQLK
jgi:extradiol dioxygenase family protein